MTTATTGDGWMGGLVCAVCVRVALRAAPGSSNEIAAHIYIGWYDPAQTR